MFSIRNNHFFSFKTNYFTCSNSVCYDCFRFGECLPLIIYTMPHGWSSLFDLSELLMPSLDERLDLPAHGRSLLLRKRKNSGAVYKATVFDTHLSLEWAVKGVSNPGRFLYCDLCLFISQMLLWYIKSFWKIVNDKNNQTWMSVLVD